MLELVLGILHGLRMRQKGYTPAHVTCYVLDAHPHQAPLTQLPAPKLAHTRS
jgi:hypothetical protein